jgi:hypothetical protein
MRSETQRIRPFFLLNQEALDRWASDVAVCFADGEDFSDKGSIHLHRGPSECRLAARLPSLDFRDLVEPLDTAQVELTFTIRDEAKRRSGVLYRQKVDLLQDPIVDVPAVSSSLTWQPPQGGTLSISLVYRERVCKTPGRPWFPGHILCAKSVGINRTAPGADFDIRPVPEDTLIEAGYPRGWLVAVQASSDHMHTPSADAPGIRILVNDRILQALGRTENTTRGSLLRRYLITEALAQFLQLAAQEEDLDETSLGGVLLKKVAQKVGNGPIQHIKNDPVIAHAVAQAYSSIVDEIRSLR